MFTSIFRITAIITLVVGALALTPAQSIFAAGVVGSGTAASCSEAAFDAAITAGGTISFNCGGAATITLTSQKVLTLNTTLEGAGLITLSGGGTTRLFSVGGVQLTTNNITLRQGSSAVGGGVIEATGAQITLNNTRIVDSFAKDQGGAIYCFLGTNGTLTLNNSVINNNASARGSGIYNDGCLLTINTSQITNNKAAGSGITSGGGIYNAGALRMSSTTLSGNDALDGGAIYVESGADALLNQVTLSANSAGYGAGIENSGALTMTNSLISNNIAQNSGGGIWNLDGQVSLTRTTLSGNTGGEGGGISSYSGHVEINTANIINNTATGSAAFGGGGGIKHSGGTFFVRNATISGNRATAADGDGGGVYQSSNDNMTLTNVTLSENTAGRFGGGFYHEARYAILQNVTISNNTAIAGSALYEAGDTGPGQLQLSDTVISGAANNCDGNLFLTSGHNVSAGTCASLSDATDRANIADAKLGPLAFNRSAFPMRTQLPALGSPLIEGGLCSVTVAADQRGVARPQGAGCDVGAVERQPNDSKRFVYLPLTLR